MRKTVFYVLAAGSLVEDVLHIYQSYNDGVALLMTTFYYEKTAAWFMKGWARRSL
ncbi:MAG: hypothetical protein ACLUTU_14395 [Blautia faecis]